MSMNEDEYITFSFYITCPFCTVGFSCLYEVKWWWWWWWWYSMLGDVETMERKWRKEKKRRDEGVPAARRAIKDEDIPLCSSWLTSQVGEWREDYFYATKLAAAILFYSNLSSFLLSTGTASLLVSYGAGGGFPIFSFCFRFWDFLIKKFLVTYYTHFDFISSSAPILPQHDAINISGLFL